MKTATPDNLNSLIEFDIPFRIQRLGANVFVIRPDDSVYPPTVMWDDESESSVDIDSDDWEPVSGYSMQYGYPGPVMHPSEFLGGGMARYVLDNPGIYVVTEVIDPTPEDDVNYTSDPIGWVLLKLKDEE